MKNLNEIPKDLEEYFYKVSPDRVVVWNKIREIVEWINKQEVNHGR